ncbi:MAG TPA: ATP-dependent DNA ligase [Acidimicrobiales bacterium]|nr:ATP-dependent DNA ligase [Acidimicrobiales bacterium]
MTVPVRPPVPPMLATLARELPGGDFLYEPKWDGFRCLAFRDGDHVELYSRNDRPLARYFPELGEALLALAESRFVMDGEIVVRGADGVDFGALMLRLHPSPSRVARLRAETPGSFVAFDLLALAGTDLRPAPFAERRAHLTEVVAGAPPSLLLTPITDDVEVAARWLERFAGGGIDGVVAKDPGAPYQAGRRSKSWLKVKRERTADCVVGGVRLLDDEPVIASLLLGLYDAGGLLRHVGVTSSFTKAERRQLVEDVRPYVTSVAGHPWEQGFALERGPIGRLAGAAGAWDPATMERDWWPLRPELVCEVAYDHLDPGGRWRHPARFGRWRPDRDPASCTLDQLAYVAPSLDEVLHPS